MIAFSSELRAACTQPRTLLKLLGIVWRGPRERASPENAFVLSRLVCKTTQVAQSSLRGLQGFGRAKTKISMQRACASGAASTFLTFCGRMQADANFDGQSAQLTRGALHTDPSLQPRVAP